MKLTISDHKPAYSDVLEYKSGTTWVQDWLTAELRLKTPVWWDIPE